MKADEVVAYAMDANIRQVFDKAKELIDFNTLDGGARLAHKPDSMGLKDFKAGHLVLPKQGAECEPGYRRGLRPDLRFGRKSVVSAARLGRTPITTDSASARKPEAG